VAALAQWARMPAWATTAAVVALLVVPAARALDVVHDAASDSGHLGTLPAATVSRLSAFLARHTQGQRYELASATATKATPLIALDGRRVLVLGTLAGHPIVPLRRFLADVRHHQVSYVLMAGRCGPHTALGPRGCGPAARWARVHGRDVSRAAGVQMYEVTPRMAHRRLRVRG
jgi:hypothetical protein